MILKAILVAALIALAEMIHGILRVALLNPRVGDRRARQIGVFTGSAIILAIAWLLAPWIHATGGGELVAVGIVWLLFLLAFEVAVGRFVMRASWKRIASDFDLRRGGLLGIGMAVLLVAPYLAAQLRGML
jgi:hypothetical protein